MNKAIHIAPLVLAAALTACMADQPDYGAFPEADDPVPAAITKAQATVTGQLALEGLDTHAYDKWSTGWSSGLREAISASAWRPYSEALEDQYGDFIELEATRLNAAESEGYVRFSFLAEFDRGYLMLVHVYPDDGEQIVGVFIRDAITGEIPEALR